MGRTSIILLTLAAVVLLPWLVGRWMMADQEESPAPPDQPWPGAAYIALPSGRTHFLDLGPRDAPAILLFHGSARGIADWQEGLAGALAHRYRVIAFDDYGNGFSDRGQGWSYGYDLWARQGMELLDALGVDRAVFVGHSVGGIVAAAAAADNPGRAVGLVTIGTGAAIDPVQILPLIPGLGEIVVGASPRLSDTFSPAHMRFIDAAHAIAGTRAAYLVYLRRQYTFDGLRILNGLIREVACPILHVSGTRDASVPHEAAKSFATESGGTFLAFDGIAHDVHVEAPEALAAAIASFSAGLDWTRPAGAGADGGTRTLTP